MHKKEDRILNFNYGFSFYETPKMAEDLIKTYSTSAHTLISFSIGKYKYTVRPRVGFTKITYYLFVKQSPGNCSKPNK